jgi:hypothetical protein
MRIKFSASHRTLTATRWKRARALCLGLCAMGMTIVASADDTPRIISFDAPGAGAVPGSFQGTVSACYFSDCSVTINIWGTITGSYLDANNNYHGFVRSPDGKFTTFDAPGADATSGNLNGTFPNSINDAGAITGMYADSNGNSHGFLRGPEGSFTTFDVPGGSLVTNSIALNLEGAAVGYYLDKNVVFHAFLRRPDGRFATWSGPGACNTTPANGCFGTAAFSINFSGTIAGGYLDNSVNFVVHGLVRSPQGKFTTYNAPGAGTGLYQGTGCPGCSVPLNQFGANAGYYVDGSYVGHGYLRSPKGEITTFDLPGQGAGSLLGLDDIPLGLNDWGTITGTYIGTDNNIHGFVRSPEGKISSFDAPAADTSGSGLGTFPVSINDQGEITGYYIDANNVFHGFLRLP